MADDLVEEENEEEEDWNWEHIQAKAVERMATAAQRLGVTQTTIDKIILCRFDRIIEKHEGPESWESTLRFYDVAMFPVGPYHVLFPLDRKHHRNITILRWVVSQDEKTLTIFLKDTTYVDEPDEELFWAGRVAVSERVHDNDFYLTTLFHEWFVVDNQKVFNT